MIVRSTDRLSGTPNDFTIEFSERTYNINYINMTANSFEIEENSSIRIDTLEGDDEYEYEIKLKSKNYKNIENLVHESWRGMKEKNIYEFDIQLFKFNKFNKSNRYVINIKSEKYKVKLMEDSNNIYRKLGFFDINKDDDFKDEIKSTLAVMDVLPEIGISIFRDGKKIVNEETSKGFQFTYYLVLNDSKTKYELKRLSRGGTITLDKKETLQVTVHDLSGNLVYIDSEWSMRFD
jgi:hypothetical protein